MYGVVAPCETPIPQYHDIYDQVIHVTWNQF